MNIKAMIIFFILNFGALGLGGFFTGDGVPSEWYQELNKAPWTPPGWVFGAAWTSIMICFSIFLGLVWNKTENRNRLIFIYGLQWMLNVIWNPIFFKFHMVLLGLVVITCLMGLMLYFIVLYRKKHFFKSLLVVPYFIWLVIATSLNAYIYLFN